MHCHDCFPSKLLHLLHQVKIDNSGCIAHHRWIAWICKLFRFVVFQNIARSRCTGAKPSSVTCTPSMAIKVMQKMFIMVPCFINIHSTCIKCFHDVFQIGLPQKKIQQQDYTSRNIALVERWSGTPSKKTQIRRGTHPLIWGGCLSVICSLYKAGCYISLVHRQVLPIVSAQECGVCCLHTRGCCMLFVHGRCDMSHAHGKGAILFVQGKVLCPGGGDPSVLDANYPPN